MVKAAMLTTTRRTSVHEAASKGSKKAVNGYILFTILVHFSVYFFIMGVLMWPTSVKRKQKIIASRTYQLGKWFLSSGPPEWLSQTPGKEMWSRPPLHAQNWLSTMLEPCQISSQPTQPSARSTCHSATKKMYNINIFNPVEIYPCQTTSGRAVQTRVH